MTLLQNMPPCAILIAGKHPVKAGASRPVAGAYRRPEAPLLRGLGARLASRLPPGPGPLTRGALL